ncbi:hypothetical protein EPO56_02060 [Patescibacteria group bacterium]|nr:MAG: hypothetical protein EPO56_02060 [Patescibacteria group bacterium]
MKSIADWQKALKMSVERKFPNSSWGESERLTSIQEQLDDVVAALSVEQKTLESADHAHQDPDHRIGALIADILILAEERNADIESELEKVLAWFEKRD